MMDLHWLSTEAKGIHEIFTNIFYVLSGTLLTVGVVVEYFQIPLGGGVNLSKLVMRALMAAFLLSAYPEISNSVSKVTDELTHQIGDYNEIKHVLQRREELINSYTFSWTSVKDSLVMCISYLAFFILYISVFITSAGVVFVWTLLYIFSPICIALFILPQTAGSTKALFRSMFEVSMWKVVWSVLATLLWSTALSDMNKQDDLNFMIVIAYDLILAVSLLLTPLIVNALLGKGIAAVGSSTLGVAASAAAFSPGLLAKKHGMAMAGKVLGSGGSKTDGVKRQFLKKAAIPPKKSIPEKKS